MNGICRAAPLASSLRRAGKRSTSDAVSFVLLIISPPQRSEARRQCKQNSLRAHANLGRPWHSVVISPPAAIRIKLRRRQMGLDDDRRALQRQRIGDLLSEESAHFARADDLMADGIDR